MSSTRSKNSTKMMIIIQAMRIEIKTGSPRKHVSKWCQEGNIVGNFLK